MNDRSSPEPKRPIGYWHPEALAFTMSLVVAFTLLATLVLLRKHGKANAYAEVLLIFSALYSGAVGIRGGTIENGKISWAGGLVILGVLFGFGVGLVQKTVIADAIEDQEADRKRQEAEKAKKDSEEKQDELLRSKKSAADATRKLAELEKVMDAARVEADARAQEVKIRLQAVFENAEALPPKVRAEVQRISADVQGLTYPLLLLQNGFYFAVEGVKTQVADLDKSLGKVATDVQALPVDCINRTSLKSALEESGLLGKITNDHCEKGRQTLAEAERGKAGATGSTAPSAQQEEKAPSNGAPIDAGK